MLVDGYRFPCKDHPYNIILRVEFADQRGFVEYHCMFHKRADGETLPKTKLWEKLEEGKLTAIMTYELLELLDHDCIQERTFYFIKGVQAHHQPESLPSSFMSSIKWLLKELRDGDEVYRTMSSTRTKEEMIYELERYSEVAACFCADTLRVARSAIKHHAERHREVSDWLEDEN